MREVGGVLLAALEDEAAPRIGSDALAQVARELPEVLVRDREREAQAARLREHAREGAGDAQEVLELVDEEEEVRAPGLRERGAREDRLPDPRDEERPDERSSGVAPTPHREIGEEDLSPVDDLAEVEGRARLAEDAPQTW